MAIKRRDKRRLVAEHLREQARLASTGLGAATLLMAAGFSELAANADDWDEETDSAVVFSIGERASD